MDKKYMWLIAGVLIGVVAANKIRTVPVLNKLPSV
jgi:hypothetical protein